MFCWNKYWNFSSFFECKEVGFYSCDKFVTQFLSALEYQVFMKEQVIVNRGETFDNLYLIEKGEVYVKDHSKGDVIATIPRYGYFGDYQIFNNSNSNVWFSSSPTERVVWYTISSSLFIKLWSESSNHTHFFKQRSLATRRIFKRLVINRHSLIEKVLNGKKFHIIILDQVLKLKRDRNHKYNQDQIIITQNFIQNKLKILQQRRTSQSTKKIDLLWDDYFEYFESQSLKDFSIDHLEQSYIESELDYFSENEIENGKLIMLNSISIWKWFYSIKKINLINQIKQISLSIYENLCF